MSTKKLTASIILLVIGGLLIPSGFVINDYLRSEVSKGVPTALLGIREEVIPEIEDNIKTQAIPDVLLGIQDAAVPEIEDMVKVQAIPTVLLGIKGEAVPEIEDMVKVQAIPEVLLGVKGEVVYQFYASVNASTAAQIMNSTIDFLWAYNFLFDYTKAKEHYFNNYTIQKNTTCPVMGISEYAHYMVSPLLTNLSYTPAAQDYLLYGNALYGLPGLITDLEQGMGILQFLGYYQLAADGNMTINAAMQAGYNATWSQLQIMAGYITGYLWENVVPGVVYSMTNYLPNELAEVMFYEQWANCTVVPGGIDLGGGLKGLELNCTEPSNLSLTTSEALWNSTNPSSFVNDTGILIWAEAASPNVTIQIQLMTTFSLDPANFTIILTWLFTTIKDNVVPPLFEADRGISATTFAEYLFYEQWANCTMNGMPVYPTGLDLGGGLTGLEVGCPSPSNISLTITIALWNSTDSSAFVNDSGIEKWLDAATDTTIQAELISTFGLNATELGLVLNWLWVKSFKDNVVPPLFEAGQGMSTNAYAGILFFEQWANGTVLPDGLPLDSGLTGFEVGLPSPSNISLMITTALFDDANSSAFVNAIGLDKWVKAEGNYSSDEYSELKTTFSLSESQLNLTLTWLFTTFKENVVPVLAAENLGMSIEDYAVILFL